MKGLPPFFPLSYLFCHNLKLANVMADNQHFVSTSISFSYIHFLMSKFSEKQKRCFFFSFLKWDLFTTYISLVKCCSMEGWFSEVSCFSKMSQIVHKWFYKVRNLIINSNISLEILVILKETSEKMLKRTL